jgi:hypothetical protein
MFCDDRTDHNEDQHKQEWLTRSNSVEICREKESFKSCQRAKSNHFFCEGTVRDNRLLSTLESKRPAAPELANITGNYASKSYGRAGQGRRNCPSCFNTVSSFNIPTLGV